VTSKDGYDLQKGFIQTLQQAKVCHRRTREAEIWP